MTTNLRSRRSKSVQLFDAMLPRLEGLIVAEEGQDIIDLLDSLVESYQMYVEAKHLLSYEAGWVWKILVAMTGNGHHAPRILQAKTEQDRYMIVAIAFDHFRIFARMDKTSIDGYLPFFCQAIAAWSIDVSSPQGEETMRIHKMARVLKEMAIA